MTESLTEIKTQSLAIILHLAIAFYPALIMIIFLLQN